MLLLAVVGCVTQPSDTELPVSADTRTGLADSVRAYLRVDAPVVALKDVAIIDGTGEEVKLAQTILIKNGLISEVGSIKEVAIPDKAEVLELSGRTVIPGIVGTHNHLHMPGIHFMPYTAPRMYLGSGVTTIQTTGSASPAREKELADAIQRGEAVGPEVVHTGPYFSGPGGSPAMIQPESIEHIADTVAYWVGQGVSWFKVYRHIKPDMLAAVIDEVHKQGAKVTGHLCSVTYQEAAEMGIDAIEHGFIHAFDLASDKRPGECSGGRSFRSLEKIEGGRVRQLHDVLIKHGVALSTTLAIFEAQTPGRAVADVRSLAVMAPEWRYRYEQQQERMRIAGEGWYFKPDWLNNSMQHDYLFYERGGLLTAGLDPGLHNFPGYGDQRNFELFVEAGFPVVDAIKVMTSNGATLLGLEDRGVIQPGKRADLVVLKGELHRHTAVIRQSEIVFKEGYGFDPVALIKDVQGRVGID
ncbi:MAG: amidohydrolase family protein [Rhodothermaceae bacterium]|nr:amidohydrolase family protein [Rhodothermaceae bacterium]